MKISVINSRVIEILEQAKLRVNLRCLGNSEKRSMKFIVERAAKCTQFTFEDVPKQAAQQLMKGRSSLAEFILETGNPPTTDFRCTKIFKNSKTVAIFSSNGNLGRFFIQD